VNFVFKSNVQLTVEYTYWHVDRIRAV